MVMVLMDMVVGDLLHPLGKGMSPMDLRATRAMAPHHLADQDLMLTTITVPVAPTPIPMVHPTTMAEADTEDPLLPSTMEPCLLHLHHLTSLYLARPLLPRLQRHLQSLIIIPARNLLVTTEDPLLTTMDLATTEGLLLMADAEEVSTDAVATTITLAAATMALPSPSTSAL